MFTTKRRSSYKLKQSIQFEKFINFWIVSKVVRIPTFLSFETNFYFFLEVVSLFTGAEFDFLVALFSSLAFV